jgi:tRNA threonylcarbamoyl adenosine modification protein (Sua5/YciO/YrdC/YwlC family)
MGVDAAVEAVRRGEIVGVPTDTLYGLATDPFRETALEEIFLLKGRPAAKPLALLVASIEHAMSLAMFTDRALDLADQHWPGALTLILPRLPTAPEWIGDRRRRTLGVRCPAHPVALELLAVSGPLAVTSANLSGGPSALDETEARALFGDAVSVYLEGTAPGGTASTIIDLTKEDPLTLREGPIVG